MYNTNMKYKYMIAIGCGNAKRDYHCHDVKGTVSLINEHFGCPVVTRDMIYTHFTRPEKSNKRIFRNGSIKIERERMPTKGELAQMELAHIESLIN